MTILKFIISTLTLFFLASCGRTIRLTDKDFSWIPCKGNEILVFNSNAGDADTIFLTGTRRQTVPSNPLDAFPTNLDHFTIASRHSDPWPSSDSRSYIERDFLELSVGEDEESYLSIYLSAKNSHFYGGSYLEIKNLDTIKPIRLQINNNEYSDVITLTPESDENSTRDDFITKIFWSKSQGLIRFDKKESIYWQLIKKYNP